LKSCHFSILLSEVIVERTPAAAVLQSPLLSAVRVAFPNLKFSIPFTDIFLSVSKAPRFACPTVVVHGERDAVIAVSHGRELAALIPEKHLRELIIFPEAGHNDVEALYWEPLMERVGQLIASLKQ
jgi:pimeloyl-ACP methyl ester carboxylesterase